MLKFKIKTIIKICTSAFELAVGSQQHGESFLDIVFVSAIWINNIWKSDIFHSSKKFRT